MVFLNELFTSPLAPWVLGGILVFIALLFGWRWRANGTALQKLVAEIRAKLGIKSLLNLSRNTERWDKFADKLNDAEALLGELASQQTLARQTLAFIERCKPLDNMSGQTRLESPVAPDEVLDLQQHLLDANVQVSFYRALPNYLVGLGLCFTFLGLAVVIYAASDVLGSAKTAASVSATGTAGEMADVKPSDSSESSNAALRNLLLAASSKFWSSLTAVACSIVYGIYFRYRSQWMSRLVSKLASDLAQCVCVVSPAELQYEAVLRLRTSEEYLANTASNIGLMKGGIDRSEMNGIKQHQLLLAKLEAVADALALKVGEEIGNMGKGIASVLGQGNTDAFDKITTTMMESLNQGLEEHLKAIVERLAEVAETLNGIPDEFTALVGLVKENTDSISAAFAAVAKPIETSLAAASSSALDMAGQFATLPDGLQPARIAASHLGQAAKMMADSSTQIEAQNQAVMRRWEELSSLVQSLDSHLAGAVEKVGGVFPDYAEKLQGFTKQWEGAMVKALEGLAGNIKDLERSHDHLREHQGAWQESSGQLAKVVGSAGDHVIHFADTIKAARTHDEAAVSRSEGRAKQLAEEMTSALRGLISELEQRRVVEHTAAQEAMLAAVAEPSREQPEELEPDPAIAA